MNPPSEQLIRDYLNRLSLAAKSRLEPGDRQALLDQTRAHIEAEAGDLGKATAAQVRRILAAIGDPIAVAESERARIAAPSDPAAASRATGAARQIWPPAGVLAIGRQPARPPAPINSSSGGGLPSQRDSLGLPSHGAGGGVPPPREPPAPSDSPPLNSPPADSPQPASLQPVDSPAPDDSHPRSGEPEPPAGESERDKDGQKTVPGREGTSHGEPDDDEPGVELNVELPGTVVYEEVGPSWLSQRASAAVDRLALFGSALVGIAVRAPLETFAVLVLGIGGAIYPPIWLVGGLIVVISRKWDLQDKWIGLAIPVVVVVFGATFAVVLGGERTSYGSYAFEAWLAAGRLSRITAILSAIFLLWRVHKGPRERRRSPWGAPHRPG
jgi:HAAS